MLAEVRSAIDGADWGGALSTALAWWRQTRAPELANLVDAINARCFLPAAPRRELHAWWMLHAQAYNPVAVGALVTRAGKLTYRNDRSFDEVRAWFAGNPVIERLLDPYRDADHKILYASLNLVHRLAAMAAWPDDPRAAQICAGWFVEGRASWVTPPFEPVTASLYELLAERMIALGDVRVDELLASSVVEPRGANLEVRTLQTRLAQQVIAALANRATALADDERAQIAAWIEHLPTRSEDRDEGDEERALWAEVLAHPDDLAARMVLADALIEQDDPRGRVIALQCQATDDREVKWLLHEYWSHWLGDAALVFERLHCTFERGMLAVATLGGASTPEWAYSRLAGNRELAAIRWLKSGFRVTPEQFLQALGDLPRMPARLTIDVPIAQAMLARAPWPIREIELVYRERHRGPTLDTASRQLARTFPQLEWLGITTRRADATAASCTLVPQLPVIFPMLAHVVLGSRAWQWQGTRAECAFAPVPP